MVLILSVFGVANMVFVALEIDYYENGGRNCEGLTSYPLYFHMILLLVQTFFLLKNPNVSELSCIKLK